MTDPVQHLVDLGNRQGCQEIDHGPFADSNVIVILDETHYSYNRPNIMARAHQDAER